MEVVEGVCGGCVEGVSVVRIQPQIVDRHMVQDILDG